MAKTSSTSAPPRPAKSGRRKHHPLARSEQWGWRGKGRAPKLEYEKELERLQTDLVQLQEWVIHKGLRLLVIFEGRDTAGKGGTIKRITEKLNARHCRIVALGTPTERERSQWYFQRYLPHLPAGGEMVFFDRSWYNRAGVERVMGFCTDDEYQEFLLTCPQIERALVRSGIIVVKYWLSISDDEQERRFLARIKDPRKQWKLSPMDLEARAHWVDYAEAKDEMFDFTDIKESPWHVVDANDKKAARLNIIAHLLTRSPTRTCPATRSSCRRVRSGPTSARRSTARRGFPRGTWCADPRPRHRPRAPSSAVGSPSVGQSMSGNPVGSRRQPPPRRPRAARSWDRRSGCPARSCARRSSARRRRAAWRWPSALSTSGSLDQSGWWNCTGWCTRSPVITASSPSEEIRTLWWPGVCPAVGSSHTASLRRRSDSTSSARPASMQGWMLSPTTSP